MSTDCQSFEMIDEFLKDRDNSSSLIEVLHKVQDYYGYIPKEAFPKIALKLQVPYSKIYGVVTFYSRFSLVPRGKYSISVCNGTACYVKGAEDLLKEFSKKLDVEMGGTTEDLEFSLIETRCLGDCANAPIVSVNDHMYTHVSLDDIDKIIEDAKEGKLDELREA